MSRQPDGTNRSIFEEVALVHLDSLHNLALRLTRNPQEAEDLTQETFLRAYRFFDRFEQGTSCRAWLFRIMRNCFINRYRRRKARPEEINFSAIEGKRERSAGKPSPTSDFDPEHALARAGIREAVSTALEKIPEEYRAALVLSLVEGYSYREVASILSCPIGTVMSRIHRARRLLRADLENLARSEGLVAASDDSAEADPPRRAVVRSIPIDMEKYRKREGRRFKDR